MKTGAYHEFARWLSSDEVHLTAWSLFADPGVAEALAATTFDSVTFDVQHGQSDIARLILGIAAVALAGKPALVRVPINDFSLCARALDAGARGVIFPMVQTGADARMLVEATKYPPVGGRSWGAHRGFHMSGVSQREFLHTENGSNAVFAMIETAEAVKNAEEILATPGLDGVFIGPNDLCISLTDGEEVQATHPLVDAACQEIARSARRHKKLAGIYAPSSEFARNAIGYGFRFIAMGSDILFLKARAEAVVSEVRDGMQPAERKDAQPYG